MNIHNGFSRRRLLQGLALLPAASLFSSRVLATNTTEEMLPMYAMALEPPPALSKIFASIRQQFDPERANKTFPHITLKQPFVFKDNNPAHEKLLLIATRNVCERLNAFPVELQDVSTFDSSVHGSVLHLRVKLSPPLHQFQQALTESVAALGGITNGLEPAQETRIYYPHLTLAQGLSHAAATAALAADIHGASNQMFVAETLVVGRCGSDQIWKKIAEIRFGDSVRTSPQALFKGILMATSST